MARSRRRSGSWPASCTRTSTPTIRRPRRSSRRRPRPTRCSPTPERRQTYDRFGHDGLRSGGFTPGGGFGSIQDIFDSLFGGGDPFGGFGGGPAAGADIGAVVEISLEDVLEDQTREVSFEAVVVCERCRGNGAEPGTPIETCPKCEGTGQIREVSRSIFGQVVRAMPCDRCGGDGRIPETPCERCGGAGRVAETRTWEVDIPAGIEDGQRVRIAGAGHAGEPGGRQGDLYVEIRVEADERFARQGTELIAARRGAGDHRDRRRRGLRADARGRARGRGAGRDPARRDHGAQRPRPAAAPRRTARRPARRLRAGGADRSRRRAARGRRAPRRVARPTAASQRR